MTNVVYVLAYMNNEKWNNSSWWNDLYPGDDVVDWIGVDAYVNAEPGWLPQRRLHRPDEPHHRTGKLPGLVHLGHHPAPEQADHGRRVGRVRLHVACSPSREGRKLSTPCCRSSRRCRPSRRSCTSTPPRTSAGKDMRIDRRREALAAFKKIAADPRLQRQGSSEVHIRPMSADLVTGGPRHRRYGLARGATRRQPVRTAGLPRPGRQGYPARNRACPGGATARHRLIRSCEMTTASWPPPIRIAAALPLARPPPLTAGPRSPVPRRAAPAEGQIHGANAPGAIGDQLHRGLQGLGRRVAARSPAAARELAAPASAERSADVLLQRRARLLRPDDRDSRQAPRRRPGRRVRRAGPRGRRWPATQTARDLGPGPHRPARRCRCPARTPTRAPRATSPRTCWTPACA